VLFCAFLGISYGIFGQSVPDQIFRKQVGEDCINWFCNTNLADLCEFIAKTPLSFQPGTRWHYSLGIDVLGRIIEIISGSPLNIFLEREVFNPLDMIDTGFYVPVEKLSRLAECYEVSPGMSFKISNNLERAREKPHVLIAGGGGLVSTLHDFNKFALCLLRGGVYNGKQLVSEHMIRTMTSNQIVGNKTIYETAFDTTFNESIGDGIGHGFGVSTIIDPSKCKGGLLSHVGEFGWGGVASTAFFIDPVKKISCLFMTQLIPSSAYPLRLQLRYLVQRFLREKEEEENKATQAI
jgi:CubicO group peptidase (beta-lactamase class C family)